MQLVKKEEFNKQIKKEFSFSFNIKKSGLYLIKIVASCKSWRQNLLNLRSFFKDDDLTLKIDDVAFPKLNGKKGLFDGEVAWNGNNLKGLNKTNIFLINLKEGNHKIQFLIDQEPYLENIEIYKIENPNLITNLASIIPIPQDGNRRQWLTIILVNQSLNHLSTTAKAKKRKRDDDDLKLIIDDQIEKNTEPKSHKHWFWCGRTLKGKTKEFSKELNLSWGAHYIEFWADRMPTVNEIILKTEIQQPAEIQIYKEIIKGQDYNRFDNEIRESVEKWNKYFKSQKYSPPTLLDPNLVKAIIYIESRIGYGVGGFPDAMQVGNSQDDAIHVLSNDGERPIEYNVSSGILNALDYAKQVKIDAPADSIYWGIRWLYHKFQLKIIKEDNAYKPLWGSWRDAVKRYGPGTEEYTNKVWKLYKNGLNPDGGENLFGNADKQKTNRSFSFTLITLLAGFLLLSGSIIFNFSGEKLTSLNASIFKFQQKSDEGDINLEDSIKEAIEEYNKNGMNYDTWRLFFNLKQQCDKIKCDGRLTFNPYLKNFIDISKDLKDFIRLVGALDFFYPDILKNFDIDNNGKKEVIFIKTDPLNTEEAEIWIIDEAENNVKFIFTHKLEYGYFYSSDSLPISQRSIEIFDLTGDAVPEIIIFAGNARGGAGIYIFQYTNNKLQEVFQNHDLTKAVYTFSDLNKNRISEIIIEGQTLNQETKKAVYEYSLDLEKFIKQQ